MKAEFSHEIALPGRPEALMPLFTARGEEAWVPGWRPRYIAPADGTTAPEMIWETGDGAGHTIWTCLAWDPAGHARYLRVTPARKVSFVDVRARAAEGGTRVRVGYRHHALTPEGAAEIAAMAAPEFAAEIESWRALILAHLATASD